MAKFNVSGKSLGWKFSTLIGQGADDLKAKVDFESKENVLVDGKIVWRTPLTAIAVSEKTGNAYVDSNVSLFVLTKSDIKSGVIYEPAGTARVTPYAGTDSQGRPTVKYTVVADAVVPVSGGDDK